MFINLLVFTNWGMKEWDDYQLFVMDNLNSLVPQAPQSTLS